MMADRRETLAMGAGATLLTLLPTDSAGAAPAARPAPGFGRDMPFDDDWRFLRGTGAGLEQPGLDDAGWRRVDLPHDWSIEDIPGGRAPDQVGPFDRNSDGGLAIGFSVGGEGWYRKRFRVDRYPADARLEVLFDGAYLETEAWLNGHRLGENVHGYIPFAFDLTPHLDRAGENVLAVHVRNLGRNNRWYSGSGLYRQVRLDVLPARARIARWGVGAWTEELANGQGSIGVTTRIKDVEPGLKLVTRLRDHKGAVAAHAESPIGDEVKQQLTMRAPRLWSPDSPYLYGLETELKRDGKVVDRMAQPFGVRIVTFDPQRGMTINGAVTRLRGGCIHHDNGLLGARAFPDADDRRVRLLKARGYNAIRSAHNPASSSLRDACDRLGMLLIEEAFDAWHSPKQPADFSVRFKDHWQTAIRAMVLAGRNSPSVILWSIGNEIPYRATAEGVQWEWKLANAVKRLDPTRPVTAGLNGILGQELIAGPETARPGFAGKVDNASTIFLDVPGYNYRIEDIEREQVEHPERIVYGSETFPKNVFDYRALMDRAPYFLGEFVWTAMDYIGEAGLGATALLEQGDRPFHAVAWPWVNAWCGDIDLIGRQKAASLARDVAWGVSPLHMAVHRPVPDGQFEWVALWGWPDELESWSWGGSEGKPLSVRVYSSGDRVELLLNGARVGEKALAQADRMKAEFAVPYAPGALEAVAYSGGKVVGRRKLETVGTPAKLRLVAEPRSGRSGRQALTFVAVEVIDALGRVLPDEQRKVALAIAGPAELVGFGSANPFAVGSFQASEAKTFRGRALAILRSQGRGAVRLQARSDGLESAAATVVLT